MNDLDLDEKTWIRVGTALVQDATHLQDHLSAWMLTLPLAVHLPSTPIGRATESARSPLYQAPAVISIPTHVLELEQLAVVMWSARVDGMLDASVILDLTQA